MSEDFNLTDTLERKRKQDIADAHKIVDAIKRCWLIEAELFDRLDRIERQNRLNIYDVFGYSCFLKCRDLRDEAGKRCPFNPPELWDGSKLKRARQMEEAKRLIAQNEKMKEAK